MMLLHRTLATTATLACLGLGLGVPGIANATQAPSSASTPQCSNADLHVSYRNSGAAAGSRYGRIRIRNVSGHRCHTGGFGGVSYVGHGDGTQIGHASIRVRSNARTYVLKPRQHLVSKVQMADPGVYSRKECRRAHVDGFRVYVPNATKSQFVPMRTIGCRKMSAPLLHNYAYRRP